MSHLIHPHVTHANASWTLPLVKAFNKGETIQMHSRITNKWIDIQRENILDVTFSLPPRDYRIKPKEEPSTPMHPMGLSEMLKTTLNPVEILAPDNGIVPVIFYIYYNNNEHEFQAFRREMHEKHMQFVVRLCLNHEHLQYLKLAQEKKEQEQAQEQARIKQEATEKLQKAFENSWIALSIVNPDLANEFLVTFAEHCTYEASRANRNNSSN